MTRPEQVDLAGLKGRIAAARAAAEQEADQQAEPDPLVDEYGRAVMASQVAERKSAEIGRRMFGGATDDIARRMFRR